ncbi:hypothetical protein KL919_001650 [Ogataea angusta]|uniref:non-specific serine/threonine protein kinase n=1 Tax=Pichia angusta TaxID=870730 RepID=A0AAN6I6J7_PICAN|nr:uncharacterized protein KL928_001600 [Ogataea angusta]KAG7820163.1 hypothetical protein KL928_001600 [Ogataea angusta]KAG7862520.1 hypothetical protein KL919_001650 [Ogataea angusta]
MLASNKRHGMVLSGSASPTGSPGPTVPSFGSHKRISRLPTKSGSLSLNELLQENRSFDIYQDNRGDTLSRLRGAPIADRKRALAETTINKLSEREEKKNNRLSTLSLATTSSVSTRSTGSSLKSIAHRIAGVVKGDGKEAVENAENIVVDTHTIPEDDPESPQLKKKSSFFRLRHSISLRSLTSRDEPTLSSSSSRRLTLNNLRKSFVGGTANNSRMSVDISLPVPNQTSRDKIKNKLRNSSSLLSISSFMSTGSNRTRYENKEVFAVRAEEYDSLQHKLLLKLCNQQRVVSFSALMNKMLSKAKVLEKLTDSSYSEVFLEKDSHTGDPQSVWKVISFGDEDLNQPTLKELIQEQSITMAMSSVPGFIKMKSATVVRGPMPSELLQLWDKYNHKHGSNNARPDDYSKNQLHLIIRLEYGGQDLEHFELKSWTQALEIFVKIVEILKRGQDAYEFEHRDLHWGNIVIKERSASSATATTQDSLADLTLDEQSSVEVKLIDYTLSRARIGGQTMFTGLDSPHFFKGKGDYQFDVYRMMRQQLAGQDEANIDWSVYSPSTNLLWLHYVVDKLLHHKKLKPLRLNPLTRSASYLNMNNLTQEADNYEQLVQLHKLLDPTRKKRKFGSLDGILEWVR